MLQRGLANSNAQQLSKLGRCARASLPGVHGLSRPPDPLLLGPRRSAGKEPPGGGPVFPSLLPIPSTQPRRLNLHFALAHTVRTTLQCLQISLQLPSCRLYGNNPRWAPCGSVPGSRHLASNPCVTARAFVGTNGRVRESYCSFLETRATNSSNLESRSFRMGDSFDFL